MGLKRTDVFKSNYVGQADLDHPVIVKIADAQIEQINGDDGKEEKAVLHFERDKIKPLILNSGNWATIEAAYGEDSDNWIGKEIEVYVDPNVMYGKKKVGGVRVRIPSGAGSPAAPAPSKAAPAAAASLSFGPQWADAVTKKVADLVAKEPDCTMDALRAHLADVHSDQAEVFGGDPMNWPRSVMPTVKAWLEQDRSIPF